MHYVALIDGTSGNFGVVVPDLPGCTSAGDTIEEAVRNAIEAIRLWVEDAEADGDKVPKARSIDSVCDDTDVRAALAKGAILAVIPLLHDSGRSAKANVSMDSGLLEAIDEAAARRGLTRSAFLATAAREKLEREAA